MSTDFLGHFLSFVAFLRFGGQLNAASHEIRAYKTFLSLGDTHFEDVESARKLVSCSRLVNVDLDRIDRQLQEIKVSLQNATQAVSWIPRDAIGNLQIGPRERLNWLLTYKDVARAHADPLRSCNDRLTEIKADIDRLIRTSNKPTPQREFFEKTQRQRIILLSDRARKNAQLYSGPGEQLSRSVTVALLTIQ
ncbi:uncharacterized protein PAC_00276 [Phialocephala subalpina]|uniref:Fungal N-terminal domain-containing protein n=1 Tax=Phialocephala subalpina TaxID=576137 RepID=A0A1L7WC93_9HELO|nr:uncharacterized protein PAC_00276 [Phialocephala subalpina]